MSYIKLKSICDKLFAVIFFFLLFPFLFIVFIILFVEQKNLPLFFQSRIGLNEKEFWIIKFKTMNDERDEHGILLSDDQRVTKIGKLLRSYSIDELLQLINVIKGEMSFIGPRPLLKQHLVLSSSCHRSRYLVKPGISGLTQVKGRNLLTLKERYELDIDYVDRVSFYLDLQIFFRTIYVVLLRIGSER